MWAKSSTGRTKSTAAAIASTSSTVPEVADAAHHLDAEGDEAVLRLEPLAEVAELVDDVCDRLLALAAEQEARMEDDEPRAARLGEPGGVVEHPERHLELLAAVGVAHEGRERRVDRERDVGRGGGGAEERRGLVVEPEAADEAELAGPVALGRERRERLLERRRLGQPAGAVADRHPFEAAYAVRPCFYVFGMPKRPSRIDLLELDIDLRLADLWRETLDVTEWNLEVVAAFLRAAYGKGYCDALTEDAPGSLCHEHGYRIPARTPARTPEELSLRSPPLPRGARGYDARVGASPARLVIALSVAAALAIFVVYTALAGNGVAQPHAEHGRRRTPATSRSSARSSAGRRATRTRAACASGSRTSAHGTPARVPVVYRGSVPDQFRTGADLVVEGTLRNGVFVAKPGSMITKCPDHYAPAKSSKT